LEEEAQKAAKSGSHQHHHVHKTPHFTHSDEMTLKFMIFFLTLRLERFVLQRDAK
jgi:hypothetical protein